MFWWAAGIVFALLVGWYVRALLTFRSGLIRANVLSYFYRRQAGEDHNSAIVRVITSRYPRSKEKQGLITVALEESWVPGTSEEDDLATVVHLMYVLETGKELDSDEAASLEAEARDSIRDHSERFGIEVTPIIEHG